MSDARWQDVNADVAATVRHFSLAVQLYEAGGFDAPGLDGYRAGMAFLHAMQSGHTSLEAALVRILELLGEEPPSGRSWHADLIRRASRPSQARGAILDPALSAAADETRQFRNVATRSYDSFVPARAVFAVEAARRISAELKGAVAAFRRNIDPD